MGTGSMGGGPELTHSNVLTLQGQYNYEKQQVAYLSIRQILVRHSIQDLRLRAGRRHPEPSVLLKLLLPLLELLWIRPGRLELIDVDLDRRTIGRPLEVLDPLKLET